MDPAPSNISQVALDKSLNLSLPQFPHLQNGIVVFSLKGRCLVVLLFLLLP